MVAMTVGNSGSAGHHCSRCAQAPRLSGQRWCRKCLTAAQRERRATRRLDAGEPVPDRGEPIPVTQAPATLPADPITIALAAYRAAVTELDRVTRETDWRRSRYTPSTVLGPLHRAVTQADAECRR